MHTGTRHTPDASCLTPRSASGLLPLRLAEPPPPQLLSPLRPTSYRSTDSPLGSSRIAATAADTNMENQEWIIANRLTLYYLRGLGSILSQNPYFLYYLGQVIMTIRIV